MNYSEALDKVRWHPDDIYEPEREMVKMVLMAEMVKALNNQTKALETLERDFDSFAMELLNAVRRLNK